MPVPETIHSDKQYRITIGRPIELPNDGGTLLPSHDEIRISGAVLKKIKDKVIDADECSPD